MQLFVQSNLAQRASRDVLRDLTHLSLHVMLDSRVESAEDADQVVRALNVLVLKMVEKSDHTAMTRYNIYNLTEFGELELNRTWDNLFQPDKF